MKIEFEIELNKKWIYDNNGETIGETNFVVSYKWLHDLFNKYYAEKYESMEDFLDAYDPECEGEFIYTKAKEDNAIKEDLGIVMYEKTEVR